MPNSPYRFRRTVSIHTYDVFEIRDESKSTFEKKYGKEPYLEVGYKFSTMERMVQ
jgi:hypothetical protein